MHLSTLDQWLSRIRTIHPQEIDLGLERVAHVASALGGLKPKCPVIIVGGTNGKGSTVAGLEAIYSAAGYRVGSFTSPMLFKHNEQVRVMGQEASDEEWCRAFEKIEAARFNIPLTPFEFHTLAALLIFQNYSLDLIILEVGLGGRLDAVNLINADLAIVTSIGIDHTALLGDTREAIAYEKAGIFRTDKFALCGDPEPPKPLVMHAKKIGAHFFYQGCDFHYHTEKTYWHWSCAAEEYRELPLNHLALQNMSTVLMAVTLLQKCLPVKRAAIDQGLAKVQLTGRIQIIPGAITEIFDVAHNPHAFAYLASRLQELPQAAHTHVVFSMLADKDIVESILAIQEQVTTWAVAPLACTRGANKETLEQAFAHAGIQAVSFFPTIKQAYLHTKNKALAGDRIIVAGSFHTVAEVFNML
jgi:dihydrofolate synthase / folylpolyglutamate synthase